MQALMFAGGAHTTVTSSSGKHLHGQGCVAGEALDPRASAASVCASACSLDGENLWALPFWCRSFPRSSTLTPLYFPGHPISLPLDSIPPSPTVPPPLPLSLAHTDTGTHTYIRMYTHRHNCNEQCVQSTALLADLSVVLVHRMLIGGFLGAYVLEVLLALSVQVHCPALCRATKTMYGCVCTCASPAHPNAKVHCQPWHMSKQG